MKKKKKWPGKLAAFLLVAAVGGYALYDYYRSSEKAKEEENRTRFLSQEIEDIQEIQITTREKPIILTKKNQSWKMTSPVQDYANSEAITSWFNQLKEEKVQNITPKEVKWEEYSLDEKANQVTFSLKSGEKIFFSVSWKPSFDEKYFIRKGDTLLMGDNSFKTSVNEKDPVSFRSLNALHTVGHPIELNYKGKERFSFTWSDYKWAFKKAAPFPLKASRLSSFWSDLNTFKALEIVGAATENNLKKYGLNKPETTIRLKFRNQSVEVRVSATKENTAFIHTSDRKYILECSKTQADKLILSEKILRDHTAPFKYKKTEVSLLELKGDTYSYTAKKNAQGEWVSVDNPEAKGKKINSKTINTLLNSIPQLKGEQYSSLPLWLPKLSVILKDNKGETQLSLKAGQPFKDSEKDMLWVQTNLSADKVAISKSALDKIFEKDPYKQTPVKKEEDKKTSPSDQSKKPVSHVTKPSADKDSKGKDSIFQYQKED
ncbi:MAG: DUF4340 domain-containing protein [Bdellovibrionales bacterium]|nr:DUF4340 domain-containing protein [Bdellovibrionales bacterium]